MVRRRVTAVRRPATAPARLRLVMALPATARQPGYRPAAVCPGSGQTRDHPAAAVGPQRHLQRRGRLYPGQPEGHVGPDRRRRGRHADHHDDRRRRTPGRGEPAQDRRRRTSSPGRRGAPGCCHRRSPAWSAGWPACCSAAMLTVIVGRAVFGSTITVGEAWAKIRGRLPALLGLAALESVGLVAADRAGGADPRRRRRGGQRRGGGSASACRWCWRRSRRWSTCTRCCRSRRC